MFYNKFVLCKMIDAASDLFRATISMEIIIKCMYNWVQTRTFFSCSRTFSEFTMTFFHSDFANRFRTFVVCFPLEWKLHFKNDEILYRTSELIKNKLHLFTHCFCSSWPIKCFSPIKWFQWSIMEKEGFRDFKFYVDLEYAVSGINPY